MDHRLGTDDLHKLNQAFAKIDTNNDGLISAQEFAEMMKAEGVDTEEINASFAAIDQDQTGYIKCVATPPLPVSFCVHAWGVFLWRFPLDLSNMIPAAVATRTLSPVVPCPLKGGFTRFLHAVSCRTLLPSVRTFELPADHT
jgi:hypothetical protein